MTDVEKIKSLLRKHEDLLKEWHDASFGQNPDQDDAYAIGEEMASLERDITFIAGDIFGEVDK